LQRYFDSRSRLQSVQEQLWNSFIRHYHFLQREDYVDAAGHLTQDGLWASKLRLDQPLVVSETIRRGVLPDDAPALLAALIAPFVMDRDRPGDERSSATLIWKYPELAGHYYQMVQHLQPLQERLQAEGFCIPLLPFWAMATVYCWALGESWEEVRELSGMDEGDLAMVILRTADHLRQIESLYETHPDLANSARRGIELILREPVLIT
jgi:superfamily II RNA helicase